MNITLEGAVEIARDAHAGQFDKSGVEYILHPLAVAQALKPFGPHAEISGILHDAVEDSAWTFQRLLGAGVPERSVRAIKGVTRPVGSKVSYLDWIRGMTLREQYEPIDFIKPAILDQAGLSPLLHVPLVPVLKLADNLHNSLPSRAVPGAEGEGLLRRYSRARHELEESLPDEVVALVRSGFAEEVLG